MSGSDDEDSYEYEYEYEEEYVRKDEATNRDGRDAAYGKRRDDSRDSRAGRRGSGGGAGDSASARKRRVALLADFRQRYPMDDRAFMILERSTPEVQDTVLDGFKPRREGDDDYSALVVTFTRNCQARGERQIGEQEDGRADRRHTRETRPRRETRDASPLSAFRERFPMDERAWTLLTRAPLSVQNAVVSDFKPKREGESDYSALVTAFVRSVQTRTDAAG